MLPDMELISFQSRHNRRLLELFLPGQSFTPPVPLKGRANAKVLYAGVMRLNGRSTTGLRSMHVHIKLRRTMQSGSPSLLCSLTGLLRKPRVAGTYSVSTLELKLVPRCPPRFIQLP